MPKFGIPISARYAAKAVEVVSAASTVLPGFKDLFVTPAGHPQYPVRQRRADQTAGCIKDSQWATFEGSAHSGQLSGHDNEIGLLSIDKAPLEAAMLDHLYTLERPGKLAVGYEFIGGTILAGILPDEMSMGENSQYPGKVLVGRSIGRSTVRNTIGVWDEKTKWLNVPPHAQIQSEGRFMVSDFPDGIPTFYASCFGSKFVPGTSQL